MRVLRIVEHSILYAGNSPGVYAIHDLLPRVLAVR
jgi:hypothetical protein